MLADLLPPLRAGRPRQSSRSFLIARATFSSVGSVQAFGVTCSDECSVVA
jgi:hypothetical protein